MTLGAPIDTSLHEIDSYNASMKKSLIDKIFFMDKVDADVFVDFGCADGSLLKMAHSIFPNFEYYGYDYNPEMIAKAAENCNGLKNVYFANSLEDIRIICKQRQKEGKKICLIFSSVIHEVYHYGPKSVDEFWKSIWDFGADFVAIREMAVSRATSRSSDPIIVARIRQCYNKDRIGQWEAQWGSLNENWSLVHFLLHYRYIDTWEREHRENYLPVNKEDLFTLFPQQYYPEFVEHYTLPFIRRKVMDDFGVQLQDSTHLKVILRKI